jgi:hypothetical protein
VKALSKVSHTSKGELLKPATEQTSARSSVSSGVHVKVKDRERDVGRLDKFVRGGGKRTRGSSKKRAGKVTRRAVGLENHRLEGKTRLLCEGCVLLNLHLLPHVRHHSTEL